MIAIIAGLGQASRHSVAAHSSRWLRLVVLAAHLALGQVGHWARVVRVASKTAAETQLAVAALAAAELRPLEEAQAPVQA
jgi:hypothetical protein